MAPVTVNSDSSILKGILEEMDIFDNVQDAFKDLVEEHQVSEVLSCALDEYFGMNQRSFNLFEEQLSESQTDESEIIGSGITLD